MTGLPLFDWAPDPTPTRTGRHGNSAEAFRLLDRSARQTVVMDCVRRIGPCTVREIAADLGFADLNAVRPRVTELLQAGALDEVGTEPDAVTGRSVYVVQVVR